MKVFKLLTYILACLPALFATACSDDFAPEPIAPGTPDGELITIITEADFPEMPKGIVTRAMGDQPSRDDLLNNLHVNLFVFDPSGVMLQFIGPENISVLGINTATQRVEFKVNNIYSSALPRRLHFVVTSALDLHAVTGGENISAMAGETTTMPALTVSDDTDAYWGVLEVPHIEENMAVDIKLIRNFVKLNIEVGEKAQSNFHLLGYTIVNRPNRGTIAPFIHSEHLFASFLNPDNSLQSYEEITAQGYYGVNPSGVESDMTHTTAAEVQAALEESEEILAGGGDSPCYFYERTQSALASAGTDAMVTYAIVVGEYRGQRYYYKIDIGQDYEGKFRFYDLLRNFQYTIIIQEVGGYGASTLQEAMNGAPHNNLSTSVVTRDLYSIGYDNEMFEVSATRVIFTEQTTDYEFRFRYHPKDGDSVDASKLRIYDINDEDREYNLSGVTASGRTAIDIAGEVITEASVQKDGEWYRLYISTRNIPADNRRYEQNIRIYYAGGAGLGRTVLFMLRRPWELTDVTVNNGSGSATIANAINSAVNVSFRLPAGISEALFPLILTFESDKQNLYCRNGSPLTVEVDKSGFGGATTDKVMLYEWRLEWADYAHADGSEGGMYTAQFNTNTTSAEDLAYNTLAIDNRGITGRTANDNTRNFCIRIANKGQKYLNPVYVNVTRSN